MICTPHQISFGDQIKKNKVGRAYNTMGERRGAWTGMIWLRKGTGDNQL